MKPAGLLHLFPKGYLTAATRTVSASFLAAARLHPDTVRLESAQNGMTAPKPSKGIPKQNLLPSFQNGGNYYGRVSLKKCRGQIIGRQKDPLGYDDIHT